MRSKVDCLALRIIAFLNIRALGDVNHIHDVVTFVHSSDVFTKSIFSHVVRDGDGVVVVRIGVMTCVWIES